MSDVTTYPLIDNFETTLSQERDGAIGTLNLNAVPGITFPSGVSTYVTVNPGRSNQQVAIIDAVDSDLKTATVSSIDVESSPGVTYSQATHGVGSIVRISNNYEARQNIVDAIASKMNLAGGESSGVFDFTINGSNFRIRRDGSDMKLSDDNQSEITLSTLASGGGADEKTKVSVNDTTAGYLNEKLTAGDGISLTETTDGGDETLDIDVDLTDTDVFATSKDAGKVPVLDGSGEIDDFLSAPIPLKADDFGDENDNSGFMTPEGTIDNYGYTITPGTTTIFAVSTTVVSIDSTTYTKRKEIEISKSGTYTVDMSIYNAGGSAVTTARIYKNGVALGTERINSSDFSEVNYSEDFTLVSGDLIQVYAKNVISGGGEVRDFTVQGTATDNRIALYAGTITQE